MVSFLCGVLARRKTPPSDPADEAAKREDNPYIQAPAEQPSASSAGESPEDGAQTTANDHQQPLPPPPGITGHHMRAASCHHHQRSNSSASKLVSSMSMRVLGSLREGVEKPRKEKKLKQEDSIWKKTIILGEKCRVPEDDEDSILYDEKGNRIATFHPKSQNIGAKSFARQTSCIEFNKADRK